jgi:hypothetical protein
MTAFMEGPEWKNTMGDLYFVVTLSGHPKPANEGHLKTGQ